MNDEARQEALFWLNDHQGQHVQISLCVELGHSTQPIFLAEGVLMHNQTGSAAYAALGPRDDIAGLYVIKGSIPPFTLDLSSDELPCIFSIEHGGVCIEFQDDLWLQITPTVVPRP